MTVRACKRGCNYRTSVLTCDGRDDACGLGSEVLGGERGGGGDVVEETLDQQHRQVTGGGERHGSGT